MFAPVSNYLRLWDFASAARVDEFIANSENVRRRIRKAWRRDARVVHPPVAVESFYWREPEDYYLVVSELVAYKRVDLAVRAFAAFGPAFARGGRWAGVQAAANAWPTPASSFAGVSRTANCAICWPARAR